MFPLSDRKQTIIDIRGYPGFQKQERLNFTLVSNKTMNNQKFTKKNNKRGSTSPEDKIWLTHAKALPPYL